MAKKSGNKIPQLVETRRPVGSYSARWTNPKDLAADLRKAFAEQDKMHFDVLIDRMLQDARCA